MFISPIQKLSEIFGNTEYSLYILYRNKTSIVYDSSTKP